MKPSTRFPRTSALLAAVLALLALALSRINIAHCSFGFGGFSCSAPFDRAADALFVGTALVVLVAPPSIVVAVWRLAAWMRRV